VELLLNILWLLLAGPGIYLWSRRRQTKPSFQLCIALACLLFLLFPVISASDDLHAMRSEMEESSPGKRVLEQIAKRSPGVASTAAPAQTTPAVEIQFLPEVSGQVAFLFPAPVLRGYCSVPTSRPPPFGLSA
jgi:hypothetical protein